MTKIEGVIEVREDPVHGLVCSVCGFSVPLPIGKGPLRTVPKRFLDNSINEMHHHIDTEHRVQADETTKIMKKPEGIDATLAERGNNYGSYEDHARITQSIKVAMMDSKNWFEMPDHLRETLEMLAHKIGRILNGDHKYLDSVRDCVGYLKLSQEIMEKTNGTTDAKVSYVVRTEEGWSPKPK
jgi:hypothetical protein